MLRHVQSGVGNRKIPEIPRFLTENLLPYKTTHFVTGLWQSLQGFQNHPVRTGFLQTERKSLRPEPAWEETRRAWLKWEEIMNRLRLMLVGAVLVTGGSALASAQVIQQDVAYHDRDRDRDRDHDRDRDRDRDRYRAYRDGDRDDRRYIDRDDRRYDRGYYDRGYHDGYQRRWDGRRWLYWNGRNWAY
jgi:hypothetical protein